LALLPLTDEGELPAGVHLASLSEVRARFGLGSARRKTLILRLERIHRVARATGHLARFVVFGSFVTGKPEPQDVDLFLVMADAFDASELTGDTRPVGHSRDHRGDSMIANDHELNAALERIRHLQGQVAHLRQVETNPANYHLSASGFGGDRPDAA